MKWNKPLTLTLRHGLLFGYGIHGQTTLQAGWC